MEWSPAPFRERSHQRGRSPARCRPARALPPGGVLAPGPEPPSLTQAAVPSHRPGRSPLLQQGDHVWLPAGQACTRENTGLSTPWATGRATLRRWEGVRGHRGSAGGRAAGERMQPRPCRQLFLPNERQLVSEAGAEAAHEAAAWAPAPASSAPHPTPPSPAAPECLPAGALQFQCLFPIHSKLALLAPQEHKAGQCGPQSEPSLSRAWEGCTCSGIWPSRLSPDFLTPIPLSQHERGPQKATHTATV